MKIFFKILLSSLISFLMLTGCSDNKPTEPTSHNYPDYYPGGIGSIYKYSVVESDSLGNILQSGTRNILYSEMYNFRGRNYITQFDSLNFGNQSTANNYLFRKTETGVFYAVDTTQISLLIPDTLKQFVSLRDEMQLLFYPLTSGSSWSLYRITAEVQPGIEVKILDIIASFVNTEQFNLNLISGVKSITTQKVKYTIELYSSIGSPPETYTAYMWFAENIGLVKFEGNQFTVNTSGGGITFEPSSNILTQELIEYVVK